uniref:Uncharacterized protein n=1 Tax=Arundo donax TaxID=35708 RepID=A0A0A9HP50_ARUDO
MIRRFLSILRLVVGHFSFFMLMI